MPTRKYNKVKKSKKSKKIIKSKRRKNKTKYTRKRIKGGSSKKRLTWEKDDSSSFFSNIINSNYVRTFLKNEPSLIVNTDLRRS